MPLQLDAVGARRPYFGSSDVIDCKERLCMQDVRDMTAYVPGSLEAAGNYTYVDI